MDTKISFEDKSIGKSITEFIEEWKQFAKDVPVLKKADLTPEQEQEAKQITDWDSLVEWATKNELILVPVNNSDLEDTQEPAAIVKMEVSFGRYVKNEG